MCAWSHDWMRRGWTDREVQLQHLFHGGFRDQIQRQVGELLLPQRADVTAAQGRGKGKVY